jgi:transcriptional regulator with XRE-family HTH domain
MFGGQGILGKAWAGCGDVEQLPEAVSGCKYRKLSKKWADIAIARRSMWSVYDMNLRNEQQQTREESFVSYNRKQAGLNVAIRPDAAPVTLSDVARMAGVSVMTVSRVMNGNPKVSAEKMDRVKTAISKLQYFPNEHAIKLRRGKGKRLPKGVIQLPALLEGQSPRQWRPSDEVLGSPLPTGQKALSEDEYTKVRSLLFTLNENLEQLASIIR